MEPIKLALPKGRLMAETSAFFERAGWGLHDYREETRSYRLTCDRFPQLQAKIFHEKDIPIQVAVGNYDLGICGKDWLEELMAKYPSSSLLKLREYSFGLGALYAVASRDAGISFRKSLAARSETVRLVSEYPNLAEAYALRIRLKRFSVFPLWGAAEVYPPESADIALMPARETSAPFNHGLAAVETVLRFNACLIVNRDRWQKNDLSEILAAIDTTIPSGLVQRKQDDLMPADSRQDDIADERQNFNAPDILRLALPDGHQQGPTVKLINKAGIQISDYPTSNGNRRPVVNNIPDLMVKVVRPQDMPMQVAAGNFDLAITGIDWLRDHLSQFPSSPAVPLLDLQLAPVRIVAVVSNELPVSNGHELRDLWSNRSDPIRIAAEYANIADKYARENHFGRYRIIPTWGATEAFLPEDADLMIENTETGVTIARHNLKIIDTIFHSTGHLIGNSAILASNKRKQEIAESVIEILKKAVET
jgi:ATP phosphoribosyltransferase